MGKNRFSDNCEGLRMKAIVVILLSGGLRTIYAANLLRIQIMNAESEMKISYSVSKQKSFRKENFFQIPDNWKKYVQLYLAKREYVTNDRLFLQSKSKKYISSPFGKNSFTKIPPIIARFLNKENPKLFTEHSFIRTAATILADNGLSSIELQGQFNWKSSSTAMEYRNTTLSSKKKIKNIFENNENMKDDDDDDLYTEERKSRKTGRTTNIYNNCTF
ncbi:hypothetical protein SNEBB_006460 [Seison nebaliae]|nr:hypothetical protein SNEBB_006460 [Seison nebaliae]